MDSEVSFDCPACGHANVSPVDGVDGVQEWTTDCENCCRPIALRVKVKGGSLLDIQYRLEQD